MDAVAQLLCVVVSLTGGIHCVSLLRNSRKPDARSGEPLKSPSRSTRRKSVCARINRFCQVLLATTFLAVAASLLAVFAYRTLPSLWKENPLDGQLRRSVETVSIEGCPSVVFDYDASQVERPIVGIDCAASHVSDHHLRHLLDEAPQLHFLNLQQTDITNDALRQLGRAARLRELILNVTRVDDLGLQPLARLTNLEYLSLDKTKITSAGLRHLADLRGLRWLSLRDTAITDAGLHRLADLRRLQTLSLRDTAITDAGLHHLADLKDLRWLSLRGTAITDTGLESLYHLDRLRELDLTWTGVTPQGISRLESRLPGLVVTPYPGNTILP